MNTKQYNLVTHWTEYVLPDKRDHLLAFAEATLDEDFSYKPKTPAKNVPYSDQRAFIDAIVAAERTRNQFDAQADVEIEKALKICERYGL